jgi:transposase
LYQVRKEGLSILEKLAQNKDIDLFYGDETRFSEQGYVPYGWQFDDEDVAIEVCKGKALNCFGILSKDNEFMCKTTTSTINSDFVIEFLDRLSFLISKFTVIVLDNASIHTSKKFKNLLEIWQQRGLHIFYLPPYSPHLNSIERLWKEIKEGWIKPSDYATADDLFYAVNRICQTIGKELKIDFTKQYF